MRNFERVLSSFSWQKERNGGKKSCVVAIECLSLFFRSPSFSHSLVCAKSNDNKKKTRERETELEDKRKKTKNEKCGEEELLVNRIIARSLSLSFSLSYVCYNKKIVCGVCMFV